MESNHSNLDIQADREAWESAVRLMMSVGVREQVARRSFGKMLSQYKVKARDMKPAIASAKAIGTQDPLPYLIAAAKSMAEATRDPGLKLDWG